MPEMDMPPILRPPVHRLLWQVSLMLTPLSAGWLYAVEPQQLAQAFESQIKPFLRSYCLDCHNAEKAKGDLDLSTIAIDSAALSKFQIWKDAAGRVHAQDMPPAPKPGQELKQPSEAERTAFISWVRDLKHLAPKDPGRGTIRRLSQVEYANTLRDLLGVDPKVADQIPKDEAGEGFSSSISPLLMEKYLLVADEILDQAIKPDQLQITWKAGQLDRVNGGKVEPGTNDGTSQTLSGTNEIVTDLTTPVDGTYSIKVRAATPAVLGKEPTRVMVRIAGTEVGELKITAAPRAPATYSITAKLTAGRSKLSLMLVNPVYQPPATPEKRKPSPATPPKPGDAAADKPGSPSPEQRIAMLETIEVIGPPAGKPSDLQLRLFTAVPGKGLSRRDAAKVIAESFARRAYRRPPTTNEIAVLLNVFDLADQQDEVFSGAVKLMLKAVLVSPAFLYLTPDAGTMSGKNGDIVAIGDHQLAAKLSYLFWSTMPDAELSALADAGKLRDPVVIEQQVRRLLMDPRSRALFEGFGAQWLDLDLLDVVAVDEKIYPQLTKEMRTAMREEVALFFGTILRDDRPVSDFIDADFTFINGTLAKTYGLEATVKGPQMTRVTLSDRNRGGVLTMPGVLTVTSLPNRTSPVKRGAWILDRILGEKPPPPPGDVPPLEEQAGNNSLALNLRQRTERHRADPACLGCHKVIDTIGFGLENFDVVGRWRTRDDTGALVDAVGELPGRQRFSTPAELKQILAKRKDDVARALTSRALAYALCRTPTGYDEVVAERIVEDVAKDGYKFQTLWVKIATSYPFLNRRISR
jgi:hypothetical protein